MAEYDQKYWRVRSYAVLTVPLLGNSSKTDEANHGKESVELPVRVSSFQLERNDHFTADSLKLTVAYRDAGVDPRYLKNATIRFWAGIADDDGNWSPNDSNFRFIGIVKHANRHHSEGSFNVEIEAHDYTSMFLAQKPYASNGYPHLNQTLGDAWNEICQHVGFWSITTGKMISNVGGPDATGKFAPTIALEFRGGVDGSRIIGEGVPERIREFGRLPKKSGENAWDVWSRCCFCLGLITFMDGDKCVVTTSTEHFAIGDAPVLLLGENVFEADEVCDTAVSNKGIGLVSYDVTTGKTIEEYYPEPGDVRINVKRSVARRKSFKPSDVQADQYDVYEYHDITDPDLLFKIAQRAYEERSRQEIQGYVKTAEPIVYTPTGSLVDMMDLKSGDNIKIQIDPESLELVRNEGGLFAKKRLIELGYTPEVANLIVANMKSIGSINSNMHSRAITTSMSEDNFEITVRYWNVLKPLGSDAAG